MRLRSGTLKTVFVSSARLHQGRPCYIVDCEGQRYYAELVEGSQPFALRQGEHGPTRKAWFETYGWLELKGVDKVGYVA